MTTGSLKQTVGMTTTTYQIMTKRLKVKTKVLMAKWSFTEVHQ